jgi:two-component sensor histidine kinase
MSRGISFFKPLSFTAVVCLFVGICRAGAPLAPLLLSGKPVQLQPFLWALEDRSGGRSAADVLHDTGSFVPLDGMQRQSPVSTYWLKTELHTSSSVEDPGRVISFSHLTFVDVYLYQDGVLLLHREAGAFRPRSQIADNDGRLYTILPLEAGKTYTLLLRVHHTKHYQPVFDFALQARREYFTNLRFKQSMDAALQGAVGLFFIYTLLSWTVSRFKAYLGLLLFIGGIGLYVISSTDYLIEWFFPENPSTGWLFNVHFLHLGLLGLYVLMAEFWQLRSNFPRLYRWGRWVPLMLAVSSAASFTVDYFWGNYNLANNINLLLHPLMLVFIIGALVTCWTRLNPAQRYLAYGIILLGASGLFLTLDSTLTHERSLSMVAAVGDCTILAIFLLFSTGLKEAMRRHELDKQAVLEELTQLQQHQNILLEQKVTERTEELNVSNRRLQKQKHLLAERNTKIETLINELNHRVKNNLQLLYSLLSLQLPMVKDGVSREILKGNIGKIRAMMLVNQKLFTFEKGRTIGLCEFITELASHLQKIYDSKEKTSIRQNIPAGIQLSDKHTLSFGLILSELFTNTFKHAFRDHPDPCISVEATAVSEHLLQFSYSDNGVGLQEGDNGEKFTMGIPLIKDLTRQMNGQMTISKDSGLSYSFTIPV